MKDTNVKIPEKNEIRLQCTATMISWQQSGYLKSITSFDIINRGNPAEVKLVPFGPTGQYIKGSFISRRYENSYGLHLSTIDSQYLVYCLPKVTKLKRWHIDIHVWIEALHWSIWPFVAMLFVIAVWVFEITKPDINIKTNGNIFLKQLIVLICCLTGEMVKVLERRKIYTFLVVAGICISGLYENSITSIITTPSPPKTFQSIKELYDNGYKIGWGTKAYYGPEPEFIYEWDLKQYGFSDILKSIFYKVDILAQDIIKFGKLLRGKFAKIVDGIGLFKKRNYKLGM